MWKGGFPLHNILYEHMSMLCQCYTVNSENTWNFKFTVQLGNGTSVTSA